MKRIIGNGYSPRGRRVEVYINERGYLIIKYVNGGCPYYVKFNNEDYWNTSAQDMRYYLTCAGYKMEG